MKNESEKDVVECQYCGQKFTQEDSEYSPETDRGIHISERHTSDEKIVRKNDYGHKRTSIVESEWKNNNKKKSAESA